jgi:HK97 family phage portal protein
LRLFGLDITRANAAAVEEKIAAIETKAVGTLQSVDNRGGWWPIIRESFTGAWQQNVEVRIDTVLTYSAVFRCISLISSDIAKLRLRLVQKDANGIWTEVENSAFSPVLRKPNGYQNRIQFFTTWLQTKLIHGNTYALKQRDNRNVVVALHILDPDRVKPLVAPDGAVYYQINADDLAQVKPDAVAVPASEIIHDRFNTFYHPLVGISPIFACGLASVQGLKIQTNSTQFFGNGSNPGGVLTAPGAISQDTAERLKAYWEANYTGANVGKVAVLGDGLKYEPMAIKAVDSQLIEQLKWTAEMVCTAFGVPAYKAGIGAPPAYNNIEALDAQYYAQCLQIHIESIEECMDQGLGLSGGLGTEFDLKSLLRMDTATQMAVLKEAVGAGVMSPNEARGTVNLPPVKGGDTPYLQEQNWALSDLADRAPPEREITQPAEIVPANDDLSDDEVADAAKAFGYAEFKEVRPMLMLPKPAAHE